MNSQRNIRFVLAILIPLVAAACIPSRDNTFDPENAPRIHAQVVVLTRNGSCPSTPPASLQLAATAFRTDCLGILATATDPGGSSLFTFQFGPAVATSDFVPSIGTATASTAGLVKISPSWLRQQAPLTTLQFTVTARSSSGRGDASVTLPLILDDAPPVSVVDADRTLPLGGFLFAPPGTPFAVTFDGSRSFDPDDATGLQYCWSFVPAQAVGGCSPDPAVTFSLPSTHRGRTVGTLIVKDSWGAVSAPLATAVDVGDGPAWISAAQGGPDVRIDTARVDVGSELAGVTRSFLPAFLGSALYFITPNGELGSAHWPIDASGTYPEVSLGSGIVFTGMAADPVRNVLYTVAGTSTAGTLDTFAVGSLSLPPVRHSSVLLPVSPSAIGAIGLPPQVTVDALGNAWVYRLQASSGLVEVSDPSSAQPLATALSPVASLLVTGVGSRPEVAGSLSAETWVLQTWNYLGSQAPQVPAQLLRYSVDQAGSPSLLQTLPLPGVIDALGLAWADSNRFWVFISGDGLRLIDANELATGGLSAGTVLDIPMDSVLEVLADPQSGDAWALQDLNVQIVHPDGTRFTQTWNASSVSEVAFDGEGAAWASGFRGFAPFGANGAISVAQFPASTLGQIDPLTGGLWVGGTDPVALVHVASDGAIDHYFTTLATGQSTTVPAPPWADFYLSPDGRSAYAFGPPLTVSGPPSSLDAIDLTTQPPTLRPVLGTSGAAAFAAAFSDNDFAQVLAPQPGQPPALWVWESGTYTYALASTGGTVTPIFSLPTLPSSEQVNVDAEADRDQATNNLCIGSTDSSSPSLMHLRLLTPAGGVSNLATVTAGPPAESFVFSVSTVSDATRDVCWVAWGCEAVFANCTQASFLAGYLPNGSLVHPLITINPFDAQIASIRAVSPDDVWVVTDIPDTTTVTLTRFQWDAAGNEMISVQSAYDEPETFVHP